MNFSIKSAFNSSIRKSFYSLKAKNSSTFNYKHKKHVLGCGSNVVDQIFRVQTIPNVGRKGFFESPIKILEKSVVGGVTLNHLSWASLLGVPTGLLAMQGDDSSGKMIRAKLAELNIEEKYIKVNENFVSGQCFVFVQEDGERSIIMAAGATSLIDQNAVREHFKSTIINHASIVTTEISQVPLSGVAELLTTARDSNIQTILDFDVSPSVAINEAKLGNADQLKQILQLCDVLKPSKHVAQELVSILNPEGKRDLNPTDLAKYLLEYSSSNLVALTNGKDASVLAMKNICIEVPTEPVKHVVDTTGAGDAFLGGIIAGLYYDGLPDSEDSLRKLGELANHVGAANLLSLGGLPEEISKEALKLKLKDFDVYKKQKMDHLRSYETANNDTSFLFNESILSDLNALKRLNQFIDMATVERVISRLLQCKGNVYTTGIGKSGIVARRLSSSLSSIGFSSHFVHTSEWMHGELGKLSSNDIVLCISHSGNTHEILQSLHFIVNREIPVISVVGSEDSKVSALSHECISYGLTHIEEPLGSIPSTSITVQEAIINGIMNVLIHKKQLTKQQFVYNHPGGEIGLSKL